VTIVVAAFVLHRVRAEQAGELGSEPTRSPHPTWRPGIVRRFAQRVHYGSEVANPEDGQRGKDLCHHSDEEVQEVGPAVGPGR
jgi:hypothetical protein